MSIADSASAAVHRGSLGIHFNGRSQYLPAEKNVPLAFGERFEVELDGFLNVCDSFLQRVALGLAAPQFRAPRIKPMPVFLITTLALRAIAVTPPSLQFTTLTKLF